MIASDFGLGVADTVQALGTSWQISKTTIPTFEKELERVHQLETRL